MLRALEHHRSALPGHVDDALDAQQVRPAQGRERLERRVQSLPGEGLFEPEAEGMDAWAFSTPKLVDQVRASGFICIHKKDRFYWTDLVVEHGVPYKLPHGPAVVRYGAMIATVEEHEREK